VESLEQLHARQLREAAQSAAGQLRRLADEVEREAGKVERVGQPGIATYGAVAEAVLHAVLWGVPNLRVDHLASHAADADIARAKGE